MQQRLPWRRSLAILGLATLAAVVAGCQRSGSGSDQAPADAACRVPSIPFALGRFGSLVDQAEYTTAPKALPPAALTASGLPPSRPAQHVLVNLPPVATQGTPVDPGSPGSCEALAFGYGLGGYTAARRPDGSIRWSAADLSNTPSGAFLFALGIAAGDARCPSGGLALPYLRQLVAFGSASTAQVPYVPSCCYFDAVDENRVWPGSERLRIGSFATFQISPSQLDLMRDLLAAGQAIAFSGPVYEGYDRPALEYGVFGRNGGSQPPLKPDSGHGQLVVGYDDQRGNPAAPGAFLIQNSFGPNWPTWNAGGRIWWAYDTFLQSQLLAAVAYPLAETAPAFPPLPAGGVPEAWLTAVNHWVDSVTPDDVYLILSLQLSAPVILESVALTEPIGGRVVTQQFGEPFSNGVVFFRRTNGRQFENGAWGLSVVARPSGGPPVTYTGFVSVSPSVPTQPPRAALAPPIFGTNGTEATLTP